MDAKTLTLFSLGALILVSTIVTSERMILRKQKTERTTIIYWEKWTGGEGEEMRRIVDWYNKSQDKIFVKYLSISGVQDKTVLAASGGNPPDVAGLWGEGLTMNVDVGAVTDMSQFAAESGVKKEDYIAPYWDGCTVNGKLYGLPSTPSSTGLHVNKDLVPEKYRDPANAPKTLEEMAEIVDKVSIIKPDGRVVLAGFLPAEPGWWNWGWSYVFGGSLFDGKNFTINRPENLRAHKWIESYAKKFGVREAQNFQSGFGSFASTQNPFLSGKVAMEIQGVWMANYIEMYKDDLNWYAAPFPYPADQPEMKGNAFVGMDIFVIPKGAKHPKEAFEFIKFVQRQDVMESLCMGHGKNSPLNNVSEEFFTKHKNPYIKLFDELARSEKAFAPPKSGIWPIVSQEMNNVFSEVSTGAKTPERSLNDAQARINQIWKRYQDQVVKTK